LLKVCDGIAFAHSRGVVHCDLKPANIMVGSHGQVYVMDWGIAHLLDDEQRARLGIDPTRRVRCDDASAHGDSAIAGTPAWMAPEQACGRPETIDPRTDVFQLGALVYFVLTGRPPYVGEGLLGELLLAQKGVVSPPAEVAGRPLPRGLCAVAQRALAAAPEQRYQSVEAFKYDLERCLGRGTFGTQSFPPGALIIKQHESGDAAYLIVAGHCEVFKTEGSRRVPLRRMGPGELFGETAILTDQPRSASVAALDAVTVMTLTRQAFEDGFSFDTWMGVLVRTLATRFRDLDGQLTALRREQLGLRVRERLLTALAGGPPAPWSQLCAALAAEHGISELDVMAIVAGWDDLTIDEARDAIGLAGR
jgi:CRP-like cAMP-binding protein